MSASAQHPPPILPNISTLPSLPDPELKILLNTLFEPSPDLHTLALPTLRAIAFSSYPEMVNTIHDQLLAIAAEVGSDASARAPLHAILAAHPRLGEKKVESAMSRMEQANLRGGDAGAAPVTAAGEGEPRAAEEKPEATESEADQLARLNNEYEQRFPGLRYVVFVNGRGRDVIMEDMKRRIARGDLAAEEKEAIDAMCDIAINRAGTIQKAAELQRRVMTTIPAA